MKQFNELVSKDFILQRKVSKSERGELLNELYEIYTSGNDRTHRKIENWKRFVLSCRNHNPPLDSKNKIVQDAFKKTKLFIKECDIKTFCIRLAHIKTEDLYYIRSIGRDKLNRGEPFGAWLFSSIKPK